MAGNGLENPRGWWYSMVIQLMTILGPLKVFHGHPDGCPEYGIQHKCRHSGLPWPTLAYTGLQWPTVAYTGLHWPTVAYSGSTPRAAPSGKN